MLSLSPLANPQAALEQKQYHHAAYDGLEDFVGRFGARPCGSDILEDAIDFMKKKAEDDGFKVSDATFTGSQNYGVREEAD